tara:strand:+ start:434 stop:802 length:369 start_codon:yes stop_codon:yes gene_type:complete
MELTGKCKEEFEKWYLQWVFNEKTFLSLRFNSEQILENWNSLHPSEKYGVLEDYFDSVGIIVEIQPICEVKISGLKIMGFRYYVNGEVNGNVILNTRQEARPIAVKKGDELRNEVLNKPVRK